MDEPSVSPHRVTQLLQQWNHGDDAALAELTPLVYEEPRRLAHHYMEGERPGHTLQTTALVNEGYLRLADQTNSNWQSRAHFFAVAARGMRGILVNYARSNKAQKRGGGAARIDLGEEETSQQNKQKRFWICTRHWKDWPRSTQEKPEWSSSNILADSITTR